MSMSENSTEGVFYGPSIPPEGVYWNIQDGKEYPACFVGGIVILTLFGLAGWMSWMLAFGH